MFTIVPALLTNDLNKMQIMVNACAEFTDFVQIDIMDNEFVPSQSITLDELNNLKISINHEAHLMVNNPIAWLDTFQKLGANQIIFHFEAKCDHQKVINAIRSKKLKVGLAINPNTKIKEFKNLINKIDTVLFMSVTPGFYGAPFIPDVLEKIKEFKMLYPDIFTGIDGGVKMNNIVEIRKSGVDYICIGSALLKAQSPALAYGQFQKMLKSS